MFSLYSIEGMCERVIFWKCSLNKGEILTLAYNQNVGAAGIPLNFRLVLDWRFTFWILPCVYLFQTELHSSFQTFILLNEILFEVMYQSDNIYTILNIFKNLHTYTIPVYHRSFILIPVLYVHQECLPSLVK